MRTKWEMIGRKMGTLGAPGYTGMQQTTEESCRKGVANHPDFEVGAARREAQLQDAPNPATPDIIAFSECTKSIPDRD